MHITRWQPKHDITTLPHLTESIFDLPLLWPIDETRLGTSFPQIDVKETDDDYRVTAALPGYQADDISVEAHGRRLTISAMSHEETERGSDEQRWWIRERRSGQVSRTITLPSAAEVEQASCVYRDGLLEITLPKAASGRGRRIPVHAGGTTRTGSHEPTGRWRWLRSIPFRRGRSAS